MRENAATYQASNTSVHSNNPVSQELALNQS